MNKIYLPARIPWFIPERLTGKVGIGSTHITLANLKILLKICMERTEKIIA
jgi:hypothetical protein